MTIIKTIVNEAENISFTPYIWSSNSNTSFTSFTGLCVNQNFELSILVLHVMPFPGSHTAANITSMIEDVLQEFEIPFYKIHLIVIGNGANIVRGINHIGLFFLLPTHHAAGKNSCIFEEKMVKDISCCKLLKD